MSQLGGGDVTRQAIFLIESGKTRPTKRTLDLIAARTGKSISYFLTPGSSGRGLGSEGDSRLEELQALCLQQQFEQAIVFGEKLLQERLSPSVEAYVQQYVGQALVRLSRPDDALDRLARAQKILESQPDPWLSVECADWEACALYLKEDRRALSVAERALKLCRSTQPRLPGTEARILEHIASIHVKNHSYDRAIAYYEDALETAGSVRDLARLGRTYHGLGMAYQQRGDLGRAVEFTHKALALYELEHDTALLARGENELGLLLMKQGQWSRAEEAFRAALAHFDESATLTAKSHVLLSLGELELKTGKVKEAMVTTKQALDLAKQLDEKLAQSSAHLLLGQIFEAEGKHRLADREFENGIRLLQSQGLSERLAEGHAAFAEILEARRQPSRASIHWKKAAKLALGQPLPAVARTAPAV